VPVVALIVMVDWSIVLILVSYWGRTDVVIIIVWEVTGLDLISSKLSPTLSKMQEMTISRK
jgi:hypothetical protein